MSNARKPWRCNYCRNPAVVWLRYTGHISRDIRPRTGGSIALYVAACAGHEGCANWQSHLDSGKVEEVIRSAGPSR